MHAARSGDTGGLFLSASHALIARPHNSLQHPGPEGQAGRTEASIPLA